MLQPGDGELFSPIEVCAGPHPDQLTILVQAQFEMWSFTAQHARAVRSAPVGFQDGCGHSARQMQKRCRPQLGDALGIHWSVTGSDTCQMKNRGDHWWPTAANR
jgi:hypothetical protein